MESNAFFETCVQHLFHAFRMEYESQRPSPTLLRAHIASHVQLELIPLKIGMKRSEGNLTKKAALSVCNVADSLHMREQSAGTLGV